MLSSTSSSADLASLLPLPSRLSSSSPAGRASPQTFDCWQLASPTQGLPSPLQLDYSDVWSVGHGGDGGGWDGLGGPLSALSAPTYMSHPFNPHSTGSPSSNGAKGVEPNRIFGASSKGGLLNQSKKVRLCRAQHLTDRDAYMRSFSPQRTVPGAKSNATDMRLSSAVS